LLGRVRQWKEREIVDDGLRMLVSPQFERLPK
jgi:hypothetical protein